MNSTKCFSGERACDEFVYFVKPLPGLHTHRMTVKFVNNLKGLVAFHNKKLKVSYIQSMSKNKFIVYTKYVFRFILGGLLVFAGVLKMQDNSALFESVAYITWLPIGLKSLIIDILPYVEVLVGGLLAFSLFSKMIDPIATVIYLIFFIFAIYGLNQGIEGDCGCFGELGESTIIGSLLGSQFGWKMVIRNGVFLLMAGFLFWKPSSTSGGS